MNIACMTPGIFLRNIQKKKNMQISKAKKDFIKLYASVSETVWVFKIIIFRPRATKRSNLTERKALSVAAVQSLSSSLSFTSQWMGADMGQATGQLLHEG